MGKAFESYDREKNRLVMILPAYFELLRFFKTEYRMVLNRMESDYRSMMEGTDWFSLCPTISFRGPADTVFSTVLDSSNGFDLKLTMTNRLEMGKKNIVLHYTDESMGHMSLPGAVMEVLAKDMTFLKGLSNGEYKESSVAKKVVSIRMESDESTSQQSSSSSSQSSTSSVYNNHRLVPLPYLEEESQETDDTFFDNKNRDKKTATTPATTKEEDNHLYLHLHLFQNTVSTL